MRITHTTLAASAVLAYCGLSFAAEGGDGPRPVPLTRPEMKQAIEDMKVRKPRIPLPELSEEDRRQLGDRANDYEAAIRQAYMPWSATQRRMQNGARGASPRTRQQDPRLTLDNTFKTELFWIVSRVNNCQYCIGHQESKLLAGGRSEDEIAALDGDWSSHTPAEQAAFAYARKLSYEPHLIVDADIEGLRKHYTDLQILEMTISIGRNQIMNRSHEAVGAAQRRDEGGYSRSEDPSLPRGTYLTPTSERFQDVVSTTAPVVFKDGQPTREVVAERPPLEAPAEVLAALEACRDRTARLPLTDDATAREVLGSEAPKGSIPAWIRLLANFPSDGAGHIRTVLATETHGDISPLLKAQLAWIVARQDRAWYATAEALTRLRAEGQTDEQVFALDGDWSEFPKREQALFTAAKQLAASPVVLTDDDVAHAVKVAGPRDTVQAMNYATIRSFFNRVTEAAGLPSEMSSDTNSP